MTRTVVAQHAYVIFVLTTVSMYMCLVQLCRVNVTLCVCLVCTCVRVSCMYLCTFSCDNVQLYFDIILYELCSMLLLITWHVNNVSQKLILVLSTG